MQRTSVHNQCLEVKELRELCEAVDRNIEAQIETTRTMQRQVSCTPSRQKP